MSGFSRGVLEALTILLAICIARYGPVNDFWLDLKARLGLFSEARPSSNFPTPPIASQLELQPLYHHSPRCHLSLSNLK